MIRIYLIRHGRQNSPLCNVDVPLEEAGFRQAKLVAKRLKLYDIQALYSSNLIRAIQTAEIIGEELSLTNRIEEAFQEISFGELTGLSDEEIKDKYSEFLKERGKAIEDLPCPGGETGQDVYNRAFPVIERIIKEAKENGIENIAIVTHGGVIRTMVAGVLGAEFAKKLCVAKELENCGITKFAKGE